MSRHDHNILRYYVGNSITADYNGQEIVSDEIILEKFFYSIIFPYSTQGSSSGCYFSSGQKNGWDRGNIFRKLVDNFS